MNTRHITRFTYEFTNFQGWRVAISRQGVSLARYFSDKQYGDSEIARAHAISFRDMVLDELRQFPEHTQEILMKHRAQSAKVYPAGLKPAAPTTTDSEHATPACSMRSNKVLHGILQDVCRRLKLDTASVLKLSLYLFTMQYGIPAGVADEQVDGTALHAAAELPEEDQHAIALHQLINELESHGRLVGMPDFEEFSTGRSSHPAANSTAQPILTPVEDAMPDNYHAASRYMRSARPSPPSPAMSFRPRLSIPHSPSISHSPAHGSHPNLADKREKYLPYSLTAAPIRPIKLKRPGSRTDLPITPPPDAM